MLFIHLVLRYVPWFPAVFGGICDVTSRVCAKMSHKMEKRDLQFD